MLLAYIIMGNSSRADRALTRLESLNLRTRNTGMRLSVPDIPRVASIAFIESFSDGESRLFVKTVGNHLLNASNSIRVGDEGHIVSNFTVKVGVVAFCAFVA